MCESTINITLFITNPNRERIINFLRVLSVQLRNSVTSDVYQQYTEIQCMGQLISQGITI